MVEVSMRQMLEAGVHFGHQTRYWHPKMAPFIFGERNKIHIINLEKTLPLFNEAMAFLQKLAARNGTILVVGTKRAAQEVVKTEATRCGMPYVNRRWMGGTLTNFRTIRRSINRLKEVAAMSEEGGLAEHLSKKEALHYRREHEKLERSLGGIKDMEGLPDALYIIDVGHEKNAVAEARKLNIPIVAVVDSNHCPDGIDYMIPGNDDAIRSIELYLKTAADAIAQGRVTIPEAAVMGGDEFVELDASGEPIRLSPKEEDERAALRKNAVPRKKTAKKKVPVGTRAAGSARAARGAEETDAIPAAEEAAADAPEPSAP